MCACPWIQGAFLFAVPHRVRCLYASVCRFVHLTGYKVHSYSQFRTVSLTCDSSRLLVTRWAELALETRISCRSVAKKGSAWQQDLFRLNTLYACNFTVSLTFDRLMSAGDGTHHACMPSMSWAHSTACPVEYLVLSPRRTLCAGSRGSSVVYIVELFLECLSVQVITCVHDNLRVPTWPPLGIRQDNFR